jgi:hypothetical protein
MRGCRSLPRASRAVCRWCSGSRWSLAGAGSGSRWRPGEMMRRVSAVMIVATAIVAERDWRRPSSGRGCRALRRTGRYVDMKTFMEHVLTPAAKIVWSVNAVVIDAQGERDLSPKSDADWEADRERRGDARRSGQRVDAPGARARSRNGTVTPKDWADAAARAYVAAEAHDPKSISASQRPARRNLRRLPSALRN